MNTSSDNRKRKKLMRQIYDMWHTAIGALNHADGVRTVKIREKN
jgi:hypothetical protein